MRLNRRTKEDGIMEIMDFMKIIAEHWVIYFYVVMALLVFLLMGHDMKNPPSQDECSRCKGVWAKERIFFTGNESLCPRCRVHDQQAKKIHENYRQVLLQR